MSAQMEPIKFRIARFNPEVDAKPYLQDYTLELEHGQDMMLLMALMALKDIDPTLSFRRSCKEGVCGSDGMNINGKNGLACVTLVSQLSKPIVIRPLPGMPIIRDLIVDLSQFYAQYERMEPYLQNSGELPIKERLQTPEQAAKLDGLYECILCACCSTACPSYWWNPDKFAGPAALLQAQRFLADSRDDATQKRLAQLNDAYSVFRCRTIMNCVDVCPKGLNPTKAIHTIQEQLVEENV